MLPIQKHRSPSSFASNPFAPGRSDEEPVPGNFLSAPKNRRIEAARVVVSTSFSWYQNKTGAQ